MFFIQNDTENVTLYVFSKELFTMTWRTVVTRAQLGQQLKTEKGRAHSLSIKTWSIMSNFSSQVDSANFPATKMYLNENQSLFTVQNYIQDDLDETTRDFCGIGAIFSEKASGVLAIEGAAVEKIKNTREQLSNSSKAWRSFQHFSAC